MNNTAQWKVKNLTLEFTPLPVLKAENETLGVFFADWFELKDAQIRAEEAVLQFAKGKVKLSVRYKMEDGAIIERATVENGGNEPFSIDGRLFGFRMENTLGFRFCAIPFRRSSFSGKLYDWTEEEFRKDKHEFPSMRNPIYRYVETENECAEGWAIYKEDGFCLMTMKYAPESIEFSVLSPAKTGMEWGGAAIGRLGDPEGGKVIGAGKEYSFGLTRYAVCENGYKGAYASFRDFMEKEGHTVPENYSPRFNWNELYDNPAWYENGKNGQTWAELLEKYYHRSDMLEAAEKARLHGCECLYLDPGWDTTFGSNIWDESRMGDMKSFAEEIKEKYGLTLGLHTPLAPWSDSESYNSDDLITLPDGKISTELCVMSKGYRKTKIERLKKLCADGADFFLYDGSWFDKPCCNPAHGHSVPSTRQEHIEAIHDLSRELHKYYPNAIIEQHDGIIGPGTPRYLPLCTFMKAGKGDADEIWAFEFMNEPLEDFRSGRAYSMYYANLAYRLPFYLHIDLRFDNEEGLSFWWFASTCRHLGVGGTDTNPVKREKQVAMTNLYRKYADYYKKGIFYGIDELIHAHTLGSSSVIDFFNPTTESAQKTVSFSPNEIGLAGDERIEITVSVPPAGHAAVIVKESGSGYTACKME